jgi:hypothetical protein
MFRARDEFKHSGFPQRHGLLVGRLWGQNQSIWRVTSETASASGGG